jgi:hypothetical protein
MAGLVPAITSFSGLAPFQDVDARVTALRAGPGMTMRVWPLYFA